MNRIITAVAIPGVVFPAAAVVAILIGWTLHQVPRSWAPGVALFLVLAVTAAGFIAAYAMGGGSTEAAQNPPEHGH